MKKENKVSLKDFIKEDKFELNSYLTYLMSQVRYLPYQVSKR